MDTKQEIFRRYFRESDSERKIARDLQISRKTVKKYLSDYLTAAERSEQEGTPETLQEYSCSLDKTLKLNSSRRSFRPDG